ncbi:hypothetical protein BU17DRAFT_80703 [Hysterangium stoloniferum]|nr:hypothetical protein BU17DRAFT_80703 [Hysterangium stoloniferum]
MSSGFDQCNRDVLAYAKGAQALRKPRNRKRTPSGKYVWTEEADLIFILGLIAWADKSVRPIDARRSFFMEGFLKNYGIIKSRKQIASRLQVLKGEWNGTIYQSLLEQTETPPSGRASMSPLHDDMDPTSAPQSPLVATPTLEVGFDQPYMHKPKPAFLPQCANSEFSWLQPGGASTSAAPAFSLTGGHPSSCGSEDILHLPSLDTEARPLPAQESLSCDSERMFHFRLPYTETEPFDRSNMGPYNSLMGQSTEYSINETYPPSHTLMDTMRYSNAGMVASLSRAVSQSESDTCDGPFSCWSDNVSPTQAGQYVQIVYPSTS